MNIDIIGAGIGGLTTAIFLKNQGTDTIVYEGAEAIRPVGAGLLLANNAMQVYDKLGLVDKLQQLGNPIRSMHITKPDLSLLNQMDLSSYEHKNGVSNLAIHRSDLQKTLFETLGGSVVKTGMRLVDIEQKEGYVLHFDNGEKKVSGLLIGADGIHSVVRDKLFEPGIIRTTDQICWRGVCSFDLPEQYKHVGLEAWGRGTRFGFARINQRQVYWYALANEHLLPEGDSGVSFLKTCFSKYDGLIRAIIDATDRDKIIKSSISDLQHLPVWHQDRVCLIGDAAHATTPNLGQGACQAIEDAYILSGYLVRETDPATAFAKFEKTRRPKTTRIVNRSRQLGGIAQLNNPLAIALRNTLMEITPASANKQQTDMMFTLQSLS